MPRPYAAGLLIALLPAALAAQGQPTPTPVPGPAQAPAAQAGGLTVTASLRTRLESWDWFDDSEAGEYTFGAALLRAGVGQERKSVGWRAEIAAPVLIGLPDDAVAAAPQGQLGLGASYYAANGGEETTGSVFLKQAYLRLGSGTAQGHRLRLGRFEFAEGSETAPANATAAAVKRDRVAHRLLGSFGFSHGQRSLDGAHYQYGRGATNVTLLAARPTQGVFRVNGWPGLEVGVGYGAVTRAFGGGAGEARVFALHYVDYRDGLTATDNRPLPVRQTDEDKVRVTTAGAHLLNVFATGAGEIDLLLWGAVQGGAWESLDHRAWAGAVEAGFQPAGVPLRPWLRAGYFRSSGDDDAADDRHETFFQVLPTPRIYARFPFFNAMNSEDAFASLVLRPGARVTLRADVHALQLAEEADLWYSGGGAFEDESFGYAGRPSGGSRDLATLADLGADFRVNPHLTLSGYVSGAWGGDVVEAIYPGGGSGRFFYLEAELRR